MCEIAQLPPISNVGAAHQGQREEYNTFPGTLTLFNTNKLQMIGEGAAVSTKPRNIAFADKDEDDSDWVDKDKLSLCFIEVNKPELQDFADEESFNG